MLYIIQGIIFACACFLSLFIITVGCINVNTKCVRKAFSLAAISYVVFVLEWAAYGFLIAFFLFMANIALICVDVFGLKILWFADLHILKLFGGILCKLYKL